MYTLDLTAPRISTTRFQERKHRAEANRDVYKRQAWSSMLSRRGMRAFMMDLLIRSEIGRAHV